MALEGLVEDWETVKKRWEAWWERQVYDRVLICVTAPRHGVDPPKIPDADPETKWTDANYMIHRWREVNRTTYFGGEALPTCWNPISVGHALYFGGKAHFANDTVWCEPAPVGEDGYPCFEGWRENRWYRLTVEAIKTFARQCKGRYLTIPFWGNQAGDILAAVRGNEELLIDIASNPDWVKSAVKQMSDILIEAHEEFWHWLTPEITGVEGSINHVGAWSPKRTQASDCDFSCMISPQAFKELFLPSIIETMHTVDHRLYHLDGPGALNHLDTLLALPEMHAIQWVPGAGKEQMLQWVPLLQYIQNKSKGLVIDVAPNEVEPLLRQLRPEGLCLQLPSYHSSCCRTETEARELLKLVTRRCRNKANERN